MIPFNKPFLSGDELSYIAASVDSGKISGNGPFTKKCHSFFKDRFGFPQVLLTSSCTDALEMSAILLDIQEGDEVILPSYTFVSTANAFILRGAKLIFVDSREDHPGMDESAVESLITDKTKAIVVVHYAGVACDMDKILEVANRHNIHVVEDAAQAVDSYYIKDGKKVPLGSIGHLSAFSFHETKNVISGEGGMLIVNDPTFAQRAEIIWEKGTNRSAFFRGEVDKYGWVDIGSSFLPSDITAAFLFAQLESIETIQKRRLEIWDTYQAALEDWALNSNIRLPHIPSFATNNAHMYYLVFPSLDKRQLFIQYLKDAGIMAVFHYLSLHRSGFYHSHHDGRELTQSDIYTDTLVRLPFYTGMTKSEQAFVIETILQFNP
jgi:dTDP-4-amino-4,6-dideoxygalactose transaminase